MAPVDIGGLRSTCSVPVGAEWGVLLAVVVAVMLAPLADAILIEPSGAALPVGQVPQPREHRRSGWRVSATEAILSTPAPTVSVDPAPVDLCSPRRCVDTRRGGDGEAVEDHRGRRRRIPGQ